MALDLTEATEDDCARLMDGCDASGTVRQSPRPGATKRRSGLPMSK
ncbi:FIG036672: Nucleoside-diphosphate-sugar epimerase [Escherichia coli IS29]|nr:FIG036672: Nucleoside-diphosphate-sugar epimerase [Escherichia coli IS29]